MAGSEGIRISAGAATLSRVTAAIGPYLAGVRLSHASDPWIEGRSILNAGNQYDRNLALDRFNKDFVKDLEMRHEFPPVKPLNPFRPVSGWNAASITMLKLWRVGLDRSDSTALPWTDRFPPTERIGKGVLQWYCPDGPEAK